MKSAYQIIRRPVITEKEERAKEIPVRRAGGATTRTRASTRTTT